MYNKKKILAVIPARGGSKGIKLKNLKKIKNISLLERAYNILTKSKYVDFIGVSTDHLLIKKTLRMKKTFIIHRPKNLSGDKVSDLKVLKHAIKFSKKIIGNFDIILMIQPTSVLRKTFHINNAIKKIILKNYDSLWSISEVDLKYNPLKQLKILKGRLNYFDKRGKSIIARQQLNKTYIRNGVVYAFKKEFLKKTKNLLSFKKNGFMIINEFQISIDTLEDLKKAKKFL